MRKRQREMEQERLRTLEEVRALIVKMRDEEWEHIDSAVHALNDAQERILALSFSALSAADTYRPQRAPRSLTPSVVADVLAKMKIEAPMSPYGFTLPGGRTRIANGGGIAGQLALWTIVDIPTGKTLHGPVTNTRQLRSELRRWAALAKPGGAG